MKVKEAMRNKSNPDVMSFAQLFRYLPDWEDQNIEWHIGPFISGCFKDDLGGFLTCIEIALMRSIENFIRTFPYEDPIIKDCPECDLSDHDLINFAGAGAQDICQEHRVRWMVGKNLLIILQMEIGKRNAALRRYSYLEDVEENHEIEPIDY